jgi:hypothetical protein
MQVDELAKLHQHLLEKMDLNQCRLKQLYLSQINSNNNNVALSLTIRLTI